MGGDPAKQSNFERHGAKIISALLSAIALLGGLAWNDLRADVADNTRAVARNDERLTTIEASRFTPKDAEALRLSLENEIGSEIQKAGTLIRAEIRAGFAELRNELRAEP